MIATIKHFISASMLANVLATTINGGIAGVNLASSAYSLVSFLVTGLANLN